MGHKWMWNPKWDGLPPEEFLVAVDPLLAGVRAKMGGSYETSDPLPGIFRQNGRRSLDLRGRDSDPGGRVRRALGCDWIEYPRRRCGERGRDFDLHHCDGARRRSWFPGVCGVVPGSVHPDYTGIEAGLSATGDIFDAIAKRAQHDGGGTLRRA